MADISEKEQEEVRRMLNTMDDATVNLMALDRKYHKQWYAEQLQHLREMDEYFAEVAKVMEMAGNNRTEEAIDQIRSNLTQVMSVYEDAIKDLERRDVPIYQSRHR